MGKTVLIRLGVYQMINCKLRGNDCKKKIFIELYNADTSLADSLGG